MNRQRTKETIGFLIAGLCLLILKDNSISLLSKIFKNKEALIHAYDLLKFTVLVLGLLFVGIKVYNLIMIFFDEEENIIN